MAVIMRCHRFVILIDRAQILRLVFEPDRVQIGGGCVGLQERNESQNVAGIRRKIGFEELGNEIQARGPRFRASET